jgi:hypothetical protein
MVEDNEVRGREEPWLHMGILQGMHQVGIHSKEFWLHFEMQNSVTLWMQQMIICANMWRRTPNLFLKFDICINLIVCAILWWASNLGQV